MFYILDFEKHNQYKGCDMKLVSLNPMENQLILWVKMQRVGHTTIKMKKPTRIE